MGDGEPSEADRARITQEAYDWATHVNEFLRRECSSHASDRFRDTTNKVAVSYVKVPSGFQQDYGVIEKFMSNLKKIMEKKDVYL